MRSRLLELVGPNERHDPVSIPAQMDTRRPHGSDRPCVHSDPHGAIRRDQLRIFVVFVAVVFVAVVFVAVVFVAVVFVV